MAKIVGYRDIPLEDLVIGQGQVRTENPGREVDELATSIEAQGLLQPIVVCPARTKGKWEILTGQRRFLAHKMLNRETISAAVLDERASEEEAKTISITENLVRRQLSGKELTDGILYLYNVYGTIKDVASATGLSRGSISKYVKYPRLLDELKKMVDDHVIDINVALKAQDASLNDDGEPVPEIAVMLAKEMEPMSGVQRKKVTEVRRNDPKKPIDEVIEDAKSGSRVIQIVATVTMGTHAAVQRVAEQENMNQDEVTASLIEEALAARGELED